MTAHVAKTGMTFLPAGGSRATSAPRRPGMLAEKVLASVRWLAEMPKRRAVLDELGRLSDHELADIGLTRGDLPRVFDPSFTASRNLPRPAGR